MISRNLEWSCQLNSGKWTLTSEYYPRCKRWAWQIDITLSLCQRMEYDTYEIMLRYKSTFSGRIRRADPMHPNVVTWGCDRGGSTTSLLSGVCRFLTWSLFSHACLSVLQRFLHCIRFSILRYLLAVCLWGAGYLSWPNEQCDHIWNSSMVHHRNIHIFCLLRGTWI